jgi:eukaryotic-like serine/threonine-protein kinase
MQPAIRAQIELSRDNAAGAIALLETSRRYDLGQMAEFWNNYLRGRAYLLRKSGAEAAGEFKSILDNRGVGVFSPLYPLAHLGLARALAIAGDTAGSRSEYQNFLNLWKDADADLAILIQARKEYDQLKDGK